jgi:hypothetical protein
MGCRDEIVRMAKYWAEPGTYRPTAGDFAWICQKAGLNVQPSEADVAYPSQCVTTGNIRIAGESKSWCGILAVVMWPGPEWASSGRPTGRRHHHGRR